MIAPPRIFGDDHPILRVTSAPVELFDAALVDLARSMVAALLSRDGRGLAAVQIGVPVRLIVVRDDRDLIIMANPVITRKLRRDVVMHEGCLSVAPMNWRNIARPAKCDAEWFDLDGTKRAQGFSGILARCVQHEVDHLDGILITDHARAK